MSKNELWTRTDCDNFIEKCVLGNLYVLGIERKQKVCISFVCSFTRFTQSQQWTKILISLSCYIFNFGSFCSQSLTCFISVPCFSADISDFCQLNDEAVFRRCHKATLLTFSRRIFRHTIWILLSNKIEKKMEIMNMKEVKWLFVKLFLCTAIFFSYFFA